MKLLESGLVANGDPFYAPKISISPFTLSSPRYVDQADPAGLEVLQNFFSGVEWSFVESGKNAIDFVLHQLDLQPQDEVWIQTSSGNSYVSRCVTEKIATHCTWSMERSARSKILYFIHEFGRDSSERLDELRASNLPVVEDAAYGLGTAVKADWDVSRSRNIIFSFPKIFEMQFGGILCGEAANLVPETVLTVAARTTATHWITRLDEIVHRRRTIYHELSEKILQSGFRPSYKLQSLENPGVFMFDVGEDLELNALKSFFNRHGCESSVFYGRHSFFLPTHQNLTYRHTEYMRNLLDVFISENST